MVTCSGHIGIHEGADGRTDVHDVMAIKPNFLTSLGYHIFLTMVLRYYFGAETVNNLKARPFAKTRCQSISFPEATFP